METKIMNEQPEVPPMKNKEEQVDGKKSYTLDTEPDTRTGISWPKGIKVKSPPPPA
jgi:hypothetical protein